MLPRSIPSLLLPAALAALTACGGDDSTQVPERPPATPPPVVETTTGAADAPPPTPPTPTPTQGVALGAPMAFAELAQTILQLTSASDRSGLAVTSSDGATFQLVLGPETDAARATALARALGEVSSTSVAWPPTAPLFTLELLAIRGGAALLDAPTTRGATIATLPDGGFFVALLGTFAAGPSAREGEGAWVYGQDSTGRMGWVRGASVAVEEGCVLSIDALASTLAVRIDDAPLAASLRGNFHLYRGGRQERGTYVVTDTYAALLSRPVNCQRATLDTRIELAEGTLEEFHFARDREQGDTFLAIATAPQAGSDEASWAFYPPRATEPSLELSLATNPALPSRRRARVHLGTRRGPQNARGYWAFSVQRGSEPPTFYTSDGSAFAEVVAAAPAPTP